MNIFAVSDIHGEIKDFMDILKIEMKRFEEKKEETPEILVFTGDLFPFRFNNKDNTVAGVKDFLNAIPIKHILYVPGNHDIPVIEDTEHEIKSDNPDRIIKSLLNDAKFGTVVEISGIKFGAFSWCYCGNAPYLKYVWARMTDSMGVIQQSLDKIPQCDVLLSHSPPDGILDKNSNGQNCGVPGLIDTCFEKGIRSIICGHIHERGGEYTSIGTKGKVIEVHNVAGEVTVIKI